MARGTKRKGNFKKTDDDQRDEHQDAISDDTKQVANEEATDEASKTEATRSESIATPQRRKRMRTSIASATTSAAAEAEAEDSPSKEQVIIPKTEPITTEKAATEIKDGTGVEAAETAVEATVTEDSAMNHESDIFTGCTILCLGSLSKKKSLFRDAIENHGGVFARTLDDDVTCVVTTRPRALYPKINHVERKAHLLDIPCVPESFVWDSIAAGKCQDIEQYRFKEDQTAPTATATSSSSAPQTATTSSNVASDTTTAPPANGALGGTATTDNADAEASTSVVKSSSVRKSRPEGLKLQKKPESESTPDTSAVEPQQQRQASPSSTQIRSRRTANRSETTETRFPEIASPTASQQHTPVMSPTDASPSIPTPTPTTTPALTADASCMTDPVVVVDAKRLRASQQLESDLKRAFGFAVVSVTDGKYRELAGNKPKVFDVVFVLMHSGFVIKFYAPQLMLALRSSYFENIIADAIKENKSLKMPTDSSTASQSNVLAQLRTITRDKNFQQLDTTRMASVTGSTLYIPIGDVSPGVFAPVLAYLICGQFILINFESIIYKYTQQQQQQQINSRESPTLPVSQYLSKGIDTVANICQYAQRVQLDSNAIEIASQMMLQKMSLLLAQLQQFATTLLEQQQQHSDIVEESLHVVCDALDMLAALESKQIDVSTLRHYTFTCVAALFENYFRDTRAVSFLSPKSQPKNQSATTLMLERLYSHITKEHMQTLLSDNSALGEEWFGGLSEVQVFNRLVDWAAYHVASDNPELSQQLSQYETDQLRASTSSSAEPQQQKAPATLLSEFCTALRRYLSPTLLSLVLFEHMAMQEVFECADRYQLLSESETLEICRAVVKAQLLMSTPSAAASTSDGVAGYVVLGTVYPTLRKTRQQRLADAATHKKHANTATVTFETESANHLLEMSPLNMMSLLQSDTNAGAMEYETTNHQAVAKDALESTTEHPSVISVDPMDIDQNQPQPSQQPQKQTQRKRSITSKARTVKSPQQESPPATSKASKTSIAISTAAPSSSIIAISDRVTRSTKAKQQQQQQQQQPQQEKQQQQQQQQQAASQAPTKMLTRQQKAAQQQQRQVSDITHSEIPPQAEEQPAQAKHTPAVIDNTLPSPPVKEQKEQPSKAATASQKKQVSNNATSTTLPTLAPKPSPSSPLSTALQQRPETSNNSNRVSLMYGVAKERLKEKERLFMPLFEAFGSQWYVSVQVHDQHVSVYVYNKEIADGKPLEKSITTIVTLRLVNHTRPSKSKVSRFIKAWNTVKAWGYSKIVPLTEIMDLSQGWLQTLKISVPQDKDIVSTTTTTTEESQQILIEASLELIPDAPTPLELRRCTM